MTFFSDVAGFAGVAGALGGVASPPIAVASKFAAAVLLGVIYGRQARYAPDPAIASRLLDLAFANRRQVFAKGTDGALAFAFLQRSDIDKIQGFKCYEAKDPFHATGTRHTRPPPPYDCVYRLRGTDSATYVAVVRLSYMSLPDLRDIDRYALGYVSMDDAAALLRKERIALP